MSKKILLVSAAAGLTLLLTACGHYGHWNGPGYHSSSHNDHGHSHYRGCGHSRY